MKIYFAGSIRGGRNDAGIYAQLIETLSEYGEVLTEHVGSAQISNEPSDEEIHQQDMRWLREADILVGEVTVPSHGVGYEIGRAVEMNKRVVCLYRVEGDQPVSAIIKGSPDVVCYEYNSVEEAIEILKRIL